MQIESNPVLPGRFSVKERKGRLPTLVVEKTTDIDEHMKQEQMEPISNPLSDSPPKIIIQDMNFFYGTVQALTKVSMPIPANQVT
ncbi:MAG: hypothetical protein QNK38_03635, partial [Nitrospirota bacterium]|nr:hypothetical protein [Nitrospirota bacterium]MDX2420155.1 hypothetical protein [Nitrospirota bacterium]